MCVFGTSTTDTVSRPLNAVSQSVTTEHNYRRQTAEIAHVMSVI